MPTFPIPITITAHVDIHVHGTAESSDAPVREILKLVRLIKTQGETIMSQESDLDAALAQLAADLDAAVARIEAKIAGSGVDLSDELATVSGLSARVAGVAADEPPA